MTLGRRLMIALCVCALAALSPASHAALIDHGAYSTDTKTKLDWLKLGALNGYSYEAVLAGALGYVDDGWRFATAEEVVDLFTRYIGPENGGYSTASASGLSSSYVEGAYDLVLKLGMNLAFNDDRAAYNLVGGCCYGDLHQVSVQGFIASTGPAPYTVAEATAVLSDPLNIYGYQADDPVPFGRWGVFPEFLPQNYAAPNISSFLVRARTVPEPGTLILLVSAVLALVIVRARRSRRTLAPQHNAR